MSFPESEYYSPSFEGLNRPIFGEELYTLLDSGTLSREAIGTIVRNRYPETAYRLDKEYTYTLQKYLRQPNPDTLEAFKKIVGKIGAFNYIRGMNVIRKNGTIDREIAPRIGISPSAAIQLLDVTQIQNDDKILELFCGGAYASFFLALEKPLLLDSVDLYTSSLYDLELTIRRAYEWIYEPVPEYLRPTLTWPRFIHADARNLISTSGDYQLRNDYTKIFLHPPYGRESTRIDELRNLSEEDAFALWVNTLHHVKTINGSPFTSYSIVPSKWVGKLEYIDSASFNNIPLKETNMFDMNIVIVESN